MKVLTNKIKPAKSPKVAYTRGSTLGANVIGKLDGNGCGDW